MAFQLFLELDLGNRVTFSLPSPLRVLLYCVYGVDKPIYREPKMAVRRLSRYVLVAALCLVTFFLLRQPLLDPNASPSSRYASLRNKILFVPGKVDWSKAQQFFPPSSYTSLPKGRPKKLPRVQHESFGAKGATRAKVNTELTEKRRKAVRHVFLRSWNAYKDQAWLWDELSPVAGGGKNTFGGWAATLVDALDTLWIMGLHDEFYEATAVAVAMDYGNTTDTAANMFETTIRHLGGLLAAYDLSGEPALLHKAQELGDMLYMGFDTPNRMPGFWLIFENARGGRQVAGTHDASASPASLGLEFTRLAQLTGDDKYYDAIERIRAFLERTQNQTKLPGMWPVNIDFQHEQVPESSFTLGALADSLYEYLPKMYILTGGLEPSYEKMYRDSMKAAVEHVLFRPMLPGNEDILFAGDAHVTAQGVETAPDGQHLACFVGGMFLLGGKTFGIDEHIGIGERLTRGCIWAYDAFPTGLMPEMFTLLKCPTLDGCEWDPELFAREGSKRFKKGFKSVRDSRYMLRPEAIESVFLLYRVTGQEELREVAWRMFESIVKATKTNLAHSAISDVSVKGTTYKMDSMEVSTRSYAIIFKLGSNTLMTELLAGRDLKVLLPDVL